MPWVEDEEDRGKDDESDRDGGGRPRRRKPVAPCEANPMMSTAITIAPMRSHVV